jgi:hypothetical protein
LMFPGGTVAAKSEDNTVLEDNIQGVFSSAPSNRFSLLPLAISSTSTWSSSERERQIYMQSKQNQRENNVAFGTIGNNIMSSIFGQK